MSDVVRGEDLPDPGANFGHLTPAQTAIELEAIIGQLSDEQVAEIATRLQQSAQLRGRALVAGVLDVLGTVGRIVVAVA